MQPHKDKVCWLTSREAQKLLKISGCELMHKRERGELKFEKRGNAYFYYFEEINQVNK